jgi:hypothetical protein
MNPIVPIVVEITVRVSQGGAYGALNLSQNITFPEIDFAGMARILAKFHELAEQLKKEAGRG